jgi:hypothetical protein
LVVQFRHAEEAPEAGLEGRREAGVDQEEVGRRVADVEDDVPAKQITPLGRFVRLIVVVILFAIEMCSLSDYPIAMYIDLAAVLIVVVVLARRWIVRRRQARDQVRGFPVIPIDHPS